MRNILRRSLFGRSLFKSFSSRTFYEVYPVEVVPEAEDKIFFAKQVENISALPHELPKDTMLASLPVNRMGVLESIREDFKNLNGKFIGLTNEVNLLKNENIGLTNEVNLLKNENIEIRFENSELTKKVNLLKNENIEIRSENSELTKKVNFYNHFTTNQLTKYLAMVMVEYTKMIEKAVKTQLFFKSGGKIKISSIADQSQMLLIYKMSSLVESDQFGILRKFRNISAHPILDSNTVYIQNSLYELRQNANILSSEYMSILICIEDCFKSLLDIEDDLKKIN